MRFPVLLELSQSDNQSKSDPRWYPTVGALVNTLLFSIILGMSMITSKSNPQSQTPPVTPLESQSVTNWWDFYLFIFLNFPEHMIFYNIWGQWKQKIKYILVNGIMLSDTSLAPLVDLVPNFYRFIKALEQNQLWTSSAAVPTRDAKLRRSQIINLVALLFLHILCTYSVVLQEPFVNLTPRPQ